MKNPLPAHLVAQWHPTKNLLKAEQVSSGSTKKVWWIGECGHEWDSIIQSRAGKQASGCPYCSGAKILSGFNDLATLFPDVAKEWDHTKNDNLLPTVVAGSTHKKVWWIGSRCGHSWEAEIANRTSRQSGCPVCSGSKAVKGVNDFPVLFPLLLAEWDMGKNIGLDPHAFTAGSNQKAWWNCSSGHSWLSSIRTRVNGSGCIYCSGNAVLKGFNDLASTCPEIAEQWDINKNINMKPEEFSKGSTYKVWWLCAKNHSWQAIISDRTRGRGCPICAGKKVLVGFNDLSFTHPHLALQWHPTKNNNLLPTEITYGSVVPVWWICAKAHEWKVSPNQRTSYKTDCPECSTSFISKGEQEIADFLTSAGLTIHQSHRKTLHPFELDIYIPDKKVAIEFNGVYWHSEKAGKDKNYHYDKWLAAKNAGVQLIQIWEDEWEANPKQIKTMLLHKLGVSVAPKIFARKTYIDTLIKSEAETFLTKHHIQGYASGSHYVGLYEKSSKELVSVIVLKKEANNALNIIRYATSKNVVGGFTKLIAFAEKTYTPKRFITFSDNCVSDGGLYENNGFIADKALAPDYRYVVNNKRAHKFGYRLKRFKDDPTLQWAEGLTEKELADLNDIPRIWDAGKIRWTKNVKSDIIKTENHQTLLP